MQYQHIIAYLTDSFPKANIIFVQNLVQESADEKTFREVYLKDTPTRKTSTLNLKSGTCKSFETECIRKKLSDETPNVIFALFEGEAPVSNFVRNLNELEGYDIIVFGLPSWNRYENIEIEYLQKLRLHLCEPNFVDYCEPAVKGFIKEFRSEFKTEPGLYAFCGFDIATFFLSALRDYGTGFYNHCPEINYTGLETRFRFVQPVPSSGFENDWVNIYRYENYRLTEVKEQPCLEQ